MNLHTYLCPITGRGLESSDCKRVGRRLLSPYADVDVQLSGWALLFVGTGLWLVGSVILTPMAPALGAAAGASFGIIAVLRFVRQFRTFRHSQAAGR